MRLIRQMRQRVSWNARLRTRHRPAALICFILVGFFSLLISIYADSSIFKYEDDSGTITFTEQWNSIPQKYRERVITLSAATLKPVEGGSSVYPPHASRSLTGEEAKDFSWRGRVSGLSSSLLTPFQLGVGLASSLLVVGTLIARRYTSNPFMRVLLKIVVVALVGGTGYLLYFLNLNAEVSILTGESLHPTTTVEDLKQTLKNLCVPFPRAIEHSVMRPIQSVIEQSKDATVGKASRTVNQSNAAITQMENTLKEIGIDQVQVNGQ